MCHGTVHGQRLFELKILRARRLAFLTTASVGFLSLSFSQLASAAGADWFTNYEQAVQAAQQQGRPIFVDFSTSWCSVCKQMDRTTLSDPVVIGRLDNFVKVKVDGDARPDLVNAFAVEAYPTFIHLDANGRVVEKREGFMRVQEMSGTLDRTWQAVSSSMALAQANNQQNSPPGEQPAGRIAEAPGGASSNIASADLNLLAPPDQEKNRERENVEVSSSNNSAAAGSLYNMSDPRLQGARNVYAMEQAGSSERRSRFGGGTSINSKLRQLAEATAQPGAIEADAGKVSSQETVAETTKQPAIASASDSEDTEAKTAVAKEVTAGKEAEAEKAAKDAAEEKARDIAAAATRKKSDQEALRTPAIQLVSAAAPPVIQSRLAGLSEAELPKPLLSRRASGVTQTMKPAAAVSSPGADKDPLATIRRIQGDDGSPKPPVSAKTQDITADSSGKEAGNVAGGTVDKASAAAADKTADADKSEKKETASAVAPRQSSSTSSSSKAKSTGKKADETAKTSKGASRSDIERWIKDADGKLVNGRKKEARAMYSKVVENDPENKFGKSDMAYVKMCSLIVDRDSDLLRREAYSKIREFEARFPKSEHKDYYTLIRAILAADLGETNEAHKLLGNFPDRFPDSKYSKIAHQTWKDLPPVKKESSKKATTSASSKTKNSRS